MPLAEIQKQNIILGCYPIFARDEFIVLACFPHWKKSLKPKPPIKLFEVKSPNFKLEAETVFILFSVYLLFKAIYIDDKIGEH